MVADPDDAEKSVTTSYAYDAHGQVTSVTREDGSVVRYAYDAVGNVVSERYFATATAATPEIAITYTYTDGGGRLVSAEQASGSGETQQSVTTSYSYDEYGRVTQQRQETEAEVGALTVNYRYNAAGQVTAVAYAKESAQGAVDPGNTELHILWYTYDDAGRLSAIHLDEGTASTTSPTNSSRLIRSYAYNAYGEIEKITDNTSFLTGGTLTTELAYTYNDYGLPVKLTYTDVDGETSTVCEETHLTYDGNGNILAEAVTEAYSGSTTRTRTYQYDLGNRLISATYDGTATTYTYDAVGNRLTRQEGTETAETYTYNYLNQLTRVQQGTAVTTYAYDARGNQTQQVQTGTGVTTTSTYGYDLANRLISSGVTNNAVNPLSTGATYAYNAQGQRVTRVEDEVITHFYYTGSALLFTTVNEYVLQTQNILDPSGTIVASKRFEGQAATGQDPYAEDYFFYRYDIRGSVTTIVDGEGAVVKSYDYDEFGVTTASGEAFFNEVTFTGSISDASGLLYMNARYYNPATARFLSQDSYTGSAFDPWTQHLYAYCNNNPVNMVDPTGHNPLLISLLVAITAVTLTGCNNQASDVESTGEPESTPVRMQVVPTPSPAPALHPTVQRILSEAQGLEDYSYADYDCAQFVRAVYRRSGADTNMISSAFRIWEYVNEPEMGYVVQYVREAGLENIPTRSILFYNDPGCGCWRTSEKYGGYDIHHVAIYAGNGMMYDSTDKPEIFGISRRSIYEILTRGAGGEQRNLEIVAYAYRTKFDS